MSLSERRAARENIRQRRDAFRAKRREQLRR